MLQISREGGKTFLLLETSSLSSDVLSSFASLFEDKGTAVRISPDIDQLNVDGRVVNVIVLELAKVELKSTKVTTESETVANLNLRSL